MSIGDKIKEYIEFRKNTVKMFKDAFQNVLNDAKEKGLSVGSIEDRGEVFSSHIEEYQIVIDVRECINDFRVPRDLPLVTEEGVTNEVKNAILEQLKL